MNYITVFSFIVTLACAIGANIPRQKCVINAHGKKNCVVLTSISPTLRAGSRSCAQSDILCWNEVALELVNDVRRQKGRNALTLGPQPQLDNAMSYASELAAKHDLSHQNLRSVTDEVRCMRWIGGENLAYNYDQSNAAAACVDQWINSQGHYENLVRESFEQVVLGLHFKNDGSVFCVQTFSYISSAAPGNANDPGCGSITGSSRSTQSTSPTPTGSSNAAGTGSSSGNDEGKNSCLCLHYSWACTTGIAASTGGVCTSLTSYNRQGAGCASACCDFCSRNPSDAVCQSSRVQKVC